MTLYCTTKEQVDQIYHMNDQYKTYGNIRNFPMMFMMRGYGKPGVTIYKRNHKSIIQHKAYNKAKRNKLLKGQTKIDKYFK